MAKRDRTVRIPFLYRGLAAALMLAVVAAAVCGIGCTVLTPKDYDLEVGQTLTETVYANREISDSAATELLKEQARAAVEPTYRLDAELREKQNLAAGHFFNVNDAVKAELSDKLGTDTPDWDSISGALSAEQLEGYAARYGIEGMTVVQLRALLTEKENDIALLKGIVLPKISANLNMLSADKLESTRELCCRELESSQLSNELKDIGCTLFNTLIVPTYIVDEQATALEREKAAAAVEEQVIKKGEPIAYEGTMLTTAQYELMVSLGYIRDAEADARLHIGIIVYNLLIFAAFGLYMLFFDRETFGNVKKMLIIAFALLITVLLSWAARGLSPLVAPTIIAPMFAALLVGSASALGAAMLTALAVGGISGGAGGVFGFEFAAVCVAAAVSGVTVVFTLEAFRKRRRARRSDVLWAGSAGALSGAIAALVIGVCGSEWTDALINAAWVLGGAVIGAVICTGTLVVWEHLFDVATPSRLNELTNANHPLLKQLMLEAPGTYHHSMVVATLAEAAAQAVDADFYLARAGGYFHDVGKLKRPQYFKENQENGINIHDTMPPKESAKIIIAHRQDSVELLTRYKLPGDVIKIASEHHGNSTVAYFYHKAKESEPDVQTKDFRYPGNRPSSVESAIVLLADCCEAAVRSINSPDRAAVEAMVKKVIASKYSDRDGMLMNAPITLAQIAAIEKSFLKTFVGLMHERIEYPE